MTVALLRWRRGALAAVSSVALVASSCSLHPVRATSLPGGVNLGSHPIHLTVEFTDVLNLVPGSDVKANDVPIGTVESIQLHNWYADVSIAVRGDVALPANATAQVLQTSLLGEEYIALAPPTSQAPEGRLGNNATISLGLTTTNPSVEQILGAVSLVLTGGAFTQLQRIVKEFNNALGDGRAAMARDLIARLGVLVSYLNSQKTGIVTAIRNLNGLAKSIAAENAVVDRTLRTLPQAAAVLDGQTQQLVTMLTSLNNLSAVAKRVINAGGADFAADLRDLDPILTQVASVGDALPKALAVVGTFPLPSNIVSAVRGDYVNGNLTAASSVSTLLTGILLNAISHSTQQRAPYASTNPSLPPFPGACGRAYPQPETANGARSC